MTHTVQFQPANKKIDVPDGTFLSEAAKQAGVFIDSPCGGNGTCKKCTVLLETDGAARTVLACQTRVSSDCVVRLQAQSSVRTLNDGSSRDVSFAPYSNVRTGIGDACFAAFDLGTTTIVCYLLDAATGEQIAVNGMQNPQSAFGADVIARATYALESGYQPLRDTVRNALNTLLDSVCRQAGRDTQNVVLASVVGNTVMHHLLLDYPVESLVRAPYRPFKSERLILHANEIDLHANESCVVLIPPVIGGFVGADTVACLTATAFDSLREPTLMLDVGTNGELALTDGTRCVSCSTAAGPAFEGANISCGMRASPGAIEHAWFVDNELKIAVIGDVTPVGICGSGLIELAAALVKAGIIEESGRFSDDSRFQNRFITMADGMKAFAVSSGDNKNAQVVLTQKDVRELQLGKAALRAGIETLLDELSLSPAQIKETLLAGAFGSHLSAEALCDIGLLPPALADGVESIGNAAGEGAKLYLKNFALFEQTETLANRTDYIELTMSSAFTDRYVDAMAFEDE